MAEERIEYRLPEVLRKLMKEKKLTYKAVACRLGLAEATIANWLNGSSNPSVYSLIGLSNVFGVTIDFLIFGE